jgi:hypothetical protein
VVVTAVCATWTAAPSTKMLEESSKLLDFES